MCTVRFPTVLQYIKGTTPKTDLFLFLCLDSGRTSSNREFIPWCKLVILRSYAPLAHVHATPHKAVNKYDTKKIIP